MESARSIEELIPLSDLKALQIKQQVRWQKAVKDMPFFNGKTKRSYMINGHPLAKEPTKYLVTFTFQKMVGNENRLNQLIRQLADGIWLIAPSGDILDVNERVSYETGYSKKELLGKNIDEIDVQMAKGSFPKIFDRTDREGVLYHLSQHQRKDGTIIDVEISATVIHMNETPLMLGSTRNISRRLEREQELLDYKNRNTAIVNVLPDILFVYDSQGNFIDCKTNNLSNLLKNVDDFIGKNMEEVLPEEVSLKGKACIQKTLKTQALNAFEYSLIMDGKRKYFETRMVPSGEKEVLAIVREVTQQKEEEELIRQLSYRDHLTGLYNRRYFNDYLDKQDHRQALPLSLIMIDVNGLKLTNDAFGHLTGDRLLKKVSQTLMDLVPESGMVSRIGGDEFVMVIPTFTDQATHALVQGIYDEIESKTIENIVVSVSIGYEVRQAMDVSLKDLFIKAENHMFRRKLVESQSMRHQTIQGIMASLKKKNEREQRHSEQVSHWASQIGQVLGFSGHELKEIQMAGLLHDIGKIAIRDEVLDKPGKLTAEEYEEIKKHAESGYQILKSVDAYSSMAEDILSHHEHLDGTGYPRGLKGDAISRNAKIIAVADAYDAMVSDRSYRKGVSHDQAIAELVRCQGTQFDPSIVAALIESFTKTPELKSQAQLNYYTN